MKKEDILKAYQDYILPTYRKDDFIFIKGKGSRLWDIHFREYLDFFPGWGVNNLGHCHPKVMCAIRDQISKLIFIPNNYYHIPQAKLAKEIVFWLGYPAKVFFCNSGAEANESAIKFVRKFGKGRFEIICFYNSFHGRTLGALSCTGQKKYQEGFEPLLEGIRFAKFNDLEDVKKNITHKTIAIMLELIQGEGGVNIADKNFVLGLRNLCDEHKLLLIVDEVQTGIGRTGKMFCFQNYEVIPDIITLAKSLAGGLPLGCMAVKKEYSDVLGPGMHASTFGGGPVVCKASLAVLKAIQKEKILYNVNKMGKYLEENLINLKNKFSSLIKEIRGMGLMWGIELNIEGKDIVKECQKKGLLINCTQDRVLRIMPALNVNQKQINKAVKILNEVFAKFI